MEYIDKLNGMLFPLFHSGIESVYNDAVNISLKTPKHTIEIFKLFLKSLENMEDSLLNNEVKRMEDKTRFKIFDNLIKAAVIGNLNNLIPNFNGNIHKVIKNRDISFKKFIHDTYKVISKKIYEQPTLIVKSDHEQYNQNLELLRIIVKDSFLEIISAFLPLKDILGEFFKGNKNPRYNGEENIDMDHSIESFKRSEQSKSYYIIRKDGISENDTLLQRERSDDSTNDSETECVTTDETYKEGSSRKSKDEIYQGSKGGSKGGSYEGSKDETYEQSKSNSDQGSEGSNRQYHSLLTKLNIEEIYGN
jgi:hypothetical protein